MSTQATTFDTFKQRLLDLKTKVDKLGTDLAAKIQALTDQIAAGTPVSQAQLEELNTIAASISTEVDTEDATVAPAPPTPPEA